MFYCILVNYWPEGRSVILPSVFATLSSHSLDHISCQLKLKVTRLMRENYKLMNLVDKGNLIIKTYKFHTFGPKFYIGEKFH